MPIQAFEMHRLKQNPQVLFTELDDGTAVLLHLESKFYFTLNKTAVFIWKTIGLKEKCSADEIVDALVQCFHVERPQAEHDVLYLLAEMKADTLVIDA